MTLNSENYLEELKSPTKDNINPSHYTYGGIECIDAIAAATSYLGGEDAFCTGNAIKYLWRWKQKNGVEDLRKAQWYINRLIQKESCIDE
jgi:CRISPR/Cas system-associated protein Cas5 (RAMP superfamily)